MNYKKVFEKVISDHRYKKNIEYDEARAGHPEGKVKYHIADLESNLEKLKDWLPRKEYYWKIKFLIHVHDTFKAEASQKVVSALDPHSHSSLAKAFASEFITDSDLLNIIQYHDENYRLWKQFKHNGYYNKEQLKNIIRLIEDWDLFLIFTIIDGYTKGKDIEKLSWFINQVRQYKTTKVDESSVKLLETCTTRHALDDENSPH